MNQKKINNSKYIIVKKWVDYSSKYGLGYILTNSSSGVYFNDGTKIILKNENKFIYSEKSAS